MTKAMKGRTLAESIYAEISDAMDLLDEITVEDHDADTMGQAELALTRAREMMVDKGALSLFAAAPAMLAALRDLLQWADADSLDNRRMSAIDAARAAIAAATGTPTGEGGHPIPAVQGIAAAPFALFYHDDGYNITVERHDGPSPARWTVAPPRLAAAIEAMLENDS